MKYFIYILCIFFGGMLFLPKSGSTQIRNLPLLIAILALLLCLYLWGLIKYAILMQKSKKLMREAKFKPHGFRFSPFANRLHGHYSVTFKSATETVNITFLVRKRKYPHYHFERNNRLEFYRSNRTVFKGNKASGGTITNEIETKLVGKQKILHTKIALDTDSVNILLFDKMPPALTDARKGKELGNGSSISDSSIYIWDLDGLSKYIDNIKRQKTHEIIFKL